MNAYLSTLSLRAKLLLGYALTFLVSVVLGNLVIFTVVHNTIEASIEKELTNTTNIITNMVKSATDASIKNYLRAVADKNRDIAQHYYDEYRQGRMSEAEAKAKASEVLLSQTIGKTGYIYGLDSKGVLRVHPKINGADLSKYAFIRQQIQSKEGYLEYEWANPGEKTPRKKAIYMSYFGPWDWIISASSYREEFKDLFKVNDFRDDILSVSLGKTGYPYVMDSRGNLIIHPKLQGQNIYESKDSNNREFIKEICARKIGKIVYPWQNPGEATPRDKLVIFNYIPELDWIVASSGYLEEFNSPLTTIAYATLLTLALVILLVVPITWYISSSINRPIQEIMQGFSLGAKGDYSSRIATASGGEVGQLAAYYNDFMAKLEESNRKLQESKAELEQRVIERTRELQEAMEALAAEKAEVDTALAKLDKANRLVLESIQYARRIQHAMLPDKQALDDAVQDLHVWWEPLHVVGGDYFWLERFGSKSLLVLADCTGHGVPGAFITLLVASALDRILHEGKVMQPSTILHLLDDMVRTRLRQDRPDATSNDGLDAAVCLWDAETRQITFAGAELPLLYYAQGEVHEIRGNRASLGYTTPSSTGEFTDHVVQVEPGMMFYMLTDGVPDHMGGAPRRLLGRRRLASLIAANVHLPMKDQILSLQLALESYRGDEPRRDDTTLLGFRPL